ncbi:MAG: hypothetical protein WBC33_13295 [Conexibacter sp.]
MFSIHRAFEHRARAVVALLVLGLAALGLAACGGGEGGSGGGSTSDAQTLLTQTFTGAHEIKSGKANLQLEITAQGDPSIRGPIKLTISGPFQGAGGDALPQFDLALDVRAQGQGFEAGLTSTSDRLFVQFGGTAYEVPAALVSRIRDSFKKAQQQSGDKQKLDLAGIDPMSWLQDPEVTGSETIGGTETEHITAQLDLDALLDDVDELLGKLRSQLPAVTGGQIPDKLSADTRQQIEDAVKSATVDVWTGTDDKTLRKLAIEVAVEPPASADGPKSVGVDFSIELQDLNEPQTIEPPASSRPLNELLGQLQGLLGGALGGGLGGDLGGGGSSASPNIDKYTQCLQDAGGDVAEAQKCAALLTE